MTPPNTLRELEQAFKQFHKTRAAHAAALLEQSRSSHPLAQQAIIDWDPLTYDQAR
jgi:hypothetical protein